MMKLEDVMGHYRQIITAAGCIAVMAISTAGFGLSQRNPAQSVEQMSKDADEIVIGNVVTGETKLVGRHFETDYHVEVHENLKNTSANLPQGKTFTLTLPGGAMTTPPLTQYVSGVPYLAPGEEVFLFLREPADPQTVAGRSTSAPPPATTPSGGKLSSTYNIIGWNQGRFNVLTRPGTGEKLVTRINLENYGLMNTSSEMRHVLNDIATSGIPLLDMQVARDEDLAAATRAKDPLEMTTTDTKKLKVEQAVQRAEGFKAIRQRGGIPVQNLDEFKAQVQAYANGSN